MLRFIVVLVVVSCIPLATADEETELLEKIYQMAQQVVNTTTELQQKNEVFEARKGFSPLHFLFPLWGFGGLHAFAIFWAVKIKIVLIVVAVGFAIFYYTKFLALKKKYELTKYGKYSGYPPGIREGGVFESPYPAAGYGYPTGYSNFLDIASFDGPDPYSGYHHDIDHHDYGHHIHYDHDHHDHDPDIFHDHDDEHDHHHDHEQILSEPPSYPAPAENPPPSMSPNRRRRVGRQRRAADDDNEQQIEFFDLGELAFNFLGVRTEGCRRRFVCELDFRARSNPVTRLAFSFISRSFFEQYRNVEGIGEKPKKFVDCSRMFKDCKDAERYNSNDDDDDDDEFSNVETSPDYTDEASTVNDHDGEAAVTEPTTLDEENSNEVRQMRQFNDDVAYFVHLDRGNLQ